MGPIQVCAELLVVPFAVQCGHPPRGLVAALRAALRASLGLEPTPPPPLLPTLPLPRPETVPPPPPPLPPPSSTSALPPPPVPGATPDAAAPTAGGRPVVLVLRRLGTRTIANHGELVAALTAALPGFEASAERGQLFLSAQNTFGSICLKVMST